MATIAAVLTDRLAGLSVELSAVRLDSLLIDHALGDGSALYSAEDAVAVKTVLVSVLTDLLAMPDVSEGSMSLRWDRSAVQSYVASLRAELGLPSATPQPLVQNQSSLW